MKYKLFAICVLLLAVSLGLVASAQVKINTNIPGVLVADTNPCSTIFNFYKYALMFSGVLAFAAIVYGGVKYTIAAGNPSGQSEGKEWVKGALLGLLLLVAAYVVLNTINPDITKCTLPTLADIAAPGGTGTVTGTFNCALTSGNLGVCSGAGCSPSPSLNAVMGCINSGSAAGAVTATTGGQHTCNPTTPSISCHFGGVSCKDGGHAFDLGKNALASKGLTLSQAISIAQTCGGSCRCESGTSIVSCANPAADHIHCNVNNSSCGCN